MPDGSLFQSELHYSELTSADLAHLILHLIYRKHFGTSACSWAMKALVFDVQALLIKMEKFSPAHFSKNGTWISSISKNHAAHTQYTFQNQNCRDYSGRILASTETLKLNKWKATLTTIFPEWLQPFPGAIWSDDWNFTFYARKGKVLLRKKQELKYFVDFPHTEILSDTKLTLMYFHKPVASFELIACDETAKMSRQQCQGINGNSACKYLKYCTACK